MIFDEQTKGGRLKASWTVTAGVVPGIIEEELTKVWYLSSEDLETDKNAFYIRQVEASMYALSLQDPAHLNWVKLEFFWL